MADVPEMFGGVKGCLSRQEQERCSAAADLAMRARIATWQAADRVGQADGKRVNHPLLAETGAGSSGCAPCRAAGVESALRQAPDEFHQWLGGRATCSSSPSMTSSPRRRTAATLTACCWADRGAARLSGGRVRPRLYGRGARPQRRRSQGSPQASVRCEPMCDVFNPAGSEAQLLQALATRIYPRCDRRDPPGRLQPSARVQPGYAFRVAQGLVSSSMLVSAMASSASARAACRSASSSAVTSATVAAFSFSTTGA